MPLAATRLDQPILHGARRYTIFGDGFVTCALVYQGNGRWHVEKSGAAREPVCLSIPEFESSHTGQRLAENFAAALAVAQEDL